MKRHSVKASMEIVRGQFSVAREHRKRAHIQTTKQLFSGNHFSDLTQKHLQKISASFILFDWEFYNNELEYE
jgi:hypothetical protein